MGFNSGFKGLKRKVKEEQGLEHKHLNTRDSHKRVGRIHPLK